MWPAVVFLLIMIAVGLWAARYNLNDEEGRQRRLEARRLQRKGRQKPMWYLMAEAENKRREEEKKKNEP